MDTQEHLRASLQERLAAVRVRLTELDGEARKLRHEEKHLSDAAFSLKRASDDPPEEKKGGRGTRAANSRPRQRGKGATAERVADVLREEVDDVSLALPGEELRPLVVERLRGRGFTAHGIDKSFEAVVESERQRRFDQAFSQQPTE